MTTQATEEPRFRMLGGSPEEIMDSLGPDELRAHLRALQGVTEAVLAHLTLPELLRELLARLRTLLGVDTATVLLCTEDGSHLAVRASKGLEEEVAEQVRIPVGKGIAGAVAVRRQPVIVDDVSSVATVSPFLQRLSSMMVAPLIVAGDILGVLHVGTLSPRTFYDRDLLLLQVVADRVALAIKNALTYDQLQHEAGELARARGSIRERDERFRMVFERSPLPMWVFDLETLRIMDANEAAARHYGWSAEELASMTIRDLRPPEEMPKLQATLSAVTMGLVNRGEFRHRRRDGSLIDVEVTTHELEWEGRPARLALIVDVTRERRAAAERERLMVEVERHRTMLQTITDNATSALMMMDTSGRGSFWNPAAERITGYSAEEALGRTLHELIHHTHPDGTPFPIEECPIDQALPYGVEVKDYEDVFIRKDGTFFPVLCAAKPILAEGGQAMGTVIEVRDMTERHQAEQALRRALEEAERANAARSEFLAAMSHELRTPLNAIAGYVDLIDAGVHGPVTDAQRQALQRVTHNQRTLLGLISDVLNYTSLEAGRLEFHPGDVPVAGVLEEVGQVMRPLADARGLELAMEPCDSRVVARADRDRVEQILLNLVGNALKFTPAGGRVALSCRVEDERVVIRVSDTGRGISPEALARIFDPFVQLERHRHESSQQGLGLGLAISRELARGMGGGLEVQSAPGAGSTFTLALPRSA